MLHCRGWVFDEVYPIRDAKVVYYENGRPVYQHKYTINYRNDVAKALGNKDAQNCGFYFMAQIHSKKALTLVLEYETEVGKGRFALGKVPADPECGRLEIEVCDGIGQIGNLDKFVNSHLVDDYVVHSALYEQEIDVIIPVYNGYEYFDELFKSVEQTNMKYRLLIVNDKSPDERVLPYLENYVANHENAILLNNEQNLGFVKSVNRALKEAKNHVVLLNTDVVVPYQWLERLMTPIVCGDKIATTTPYTTCGTLCSFPEIGKDNTLVADLSMWQMDNVFRTIKPKYPEIPTGVGFCMGMNKEAIREVGYLDEENFGKGYGEENDWCRRAVKCGYKNVHVDNMFAYHKHGGSFLSEEKKALLERNSKTLLSKHPDYNKVVASYFSADPLKTTRYYVYMQLLNRMTSVKTVLAFNHNWGGGATEYLVKKQKEYLRDGYKFIILTYDSDNDKYLVDYRYKEEKIGFASDNLETALNNIGRVDEIWINEIVTYRDLYETMRQIRLWKKEQGAELRMLLHDYFAICPAVNLMDHEGKYCNVGNQEQCQHCIPNNSKNTCAEFCSAAMWRQNWQRFLESCDKVVAFSEISRSLLKKAYPSLNNIVLIPHEPYFVPALNKKVKTTKTLNIGLLGILTYNKGLNVVKAMVEEIEKQNLDVRIKLIGAADEVPDSKVFSQTGRYRREDLPRLTLEQDIDIFFIPAIWPETFSYTTSEIMSMNMPIAVFNIGAPVERVSKYEKGLVLECDASVSEIVEKIVRFAKEDCAIEHMPVDEEKTLFLAQEVSFASRYRVEHFREQLIYQGYPSDYYQIQDADNLDISQYKNVVIYRCDDVERVRMIVEKAKARQIPVYYDIDDFIFDYQKISYLEFLKDEEYATFEQKTKRIFSCMDLCDGYLTSTEMLKQQIEEHFPGKQVTMKRNVASMAMQILSHNAVVERADNGDKIWIGYFSGSATHNKDFELIKDALEEIMIAYPAVCLKLGGVIQESILEQYPNRVEKLPFMKWQKLPAAVASCDINLMPLEDSLFHCCKSENKWMEAALVKVPSVMSRNHEMEKVVEHDVTGILCSTKEEWKQAIISLIEDKNKRLAIANAANRVVLEKYVTQDSGKEAIALLEKR